MEFMNYTGFYKWWWGNLSNMENQISILHFGLAISFYFEA